MFTHSKSMNEMEELFFEPTFKFLICKQHGSGIHPTTVAVVRHLRSKGHHCPGETLKRTISVLADLPLASLEDVINATPAVDLQPVAAPIHYLRVGRGWSCTACRGRFLSTSLELLKRHAALQHGRRRGQPPLWEACKLQTFFSETKDRRYFRVANALGITTVASCGNPASEYSDSRYAKENASMVSIRTPPSQINTIILQHPFIHCAAKYVRLPIHRLDHLLKSEAFTAAAHPIFDSSHIDSALSMRAVFPQSEDEPVFVNALLYATVQLYNRGSRTFEGLSLQAKTLSLLQEKLTSQPYILTPPILGAIMMLKSAAYKTGDRPGHIAHTAGLANALVISADKGTVLTPAARRATFWLNLSAALVMDCKRDKKIGLAGNHSWQRESMSVRAKDPPLGFARLQTSLPDGLLDCIVDTVELQYFLRRETEALSSDITPSQDNNPMQASIELRLSSLAHSCVDIGVVAEAVRLGVFMCYCCIWMEFWNDSLVPCKLAAKLLDILEPTVLFGPQQPSSVWLQHMDLLMWLLLVGSSVVELDTGQVQYLKSRHNSLIESFISALPLLNRLSEVDLKRDLRFALQDFIYKDRWVQNRHKIKHWFMLEFTINILED